MQVLGLIFHRMGRPRSFPSNRLMAADCVPVHCSLQPGMLRVEEPADSYPAAGFFSSEDGTTYAARGVRGNLVNVRHATHPS